MMTWIAIAMIVGAGFVIYKRKAEVKAKWDQVWAKMKSGPDQE